jgi:hypothetical protein
MHGRNLAQTNHEHPIWHTQRKRTSTEVPGPALGDLRYLRFAQFVKAATRRSDRFSGKGGTELEVAAAGMRGCGL